MLLESRSPGPPPLVEPMQDGDVKKVNATFKAAFKGNPQKDYLEDTPDAPKNNYVLELISDLSAAMRMHWTLRRGWAFTVNHGDAYVTARPASSTLEAPNRLTRIIDTIFRSVTSRLDAISHSPEQLNRRKELGAKIQSLEKSVLGNQRSEVIFLDTLATSPACQGRGYGSALVRKITDLADAQRRDTFLYSSSLDNLPFYNAMGFSSVGEILLGGDNPTWEREPVPVTMMIRPYTTEKCASQCETVLARV